MDPFFTTNDSEIPLLEGLYIKERTPPAVIAGANLSATSICAETIRGPVGRAIECTSPARVLQVFGGRDRGAGGAIANKLWLAMLNKQFGKVLVTRVAAAAAAPATHNFSDVVPTAIAKVDATSVGAWGGDVHAQCVVPSATGVAGQFDVIATYNGDTKKYIGFDFTGTNDNSLQIVGGDDANWIKVSKLAPGTPIAAASVALSGGADGTVADSDYTATNKGLEVAARAKDSQGVGAGCVLVAEKMSAAIKTKIQALAPAASDRLFLVCPDSDSVDDTTAATEVAGFTRSDRIVYCYNHPYTQDPDTATEVLTHPTAWLAGVLSQIDVDIHPGEEDTKALNAGITRLTFESMDRGQYKALKAAGICALEKDGGFAFLSGVTTSMTSGKEEITRRRMTDFLQISGAKALKNQVKKKNTLQRRKAIHGLLDGFCGDLQTAERVIDTPVDGSPGYQIDGEILNNDRDRGRGIERVLWRVRLIGHILELVLETEIGTQVVIKERS